MNDLNTDNARPATTASRSPRGRTVLLWVLVGCLAGAVLMAIFIAYGQPALLLEQMNLRYCG